MHPTSVRRYRPHVSLQILDERSVHVTHRVKVANRVISILLASSIKCDTKLTITHSIHQRYKGIQSVCCRRKGIFQGQQGACDDIDGSGRKPRSDDQSGNIKCLQKRCNNAK